MVFSCEFFKIFKKNFFKKNATAPLIFNPLSASFTKWSNTLTQFVGNLPTNCLSVFDHLVGLALKGFSSAPIEEILKQRYWSIKSTRQKFCNKSIIQEGRLFQ